MIEGPQYPRKRLYTILAVVIVVVAAAGLAARPTFHWVKEWRALQLTEASAQALRAGDAATAAAKARAAYQLWPFDARVVRQMATIGLMVDPPRALPYWLRTWFLSHDPADLRQVVECALGAGNLPLAVEYYNQLRKTNPDNPLTWMEEAHLRLAQNQWSEALVLLKRVMDSGKGPQDAHLLYAQATQFSPDPKVRALGLEHLRLLSTRSDDLGLRALRGLATFGGQSYADVEGLAEQLQNHPLATRDDKLLALRMRGMLPRADDDSLVKAARDLFPAGDANGLAEVGHWLISQNKYTQVLKLIDSDTALTRRDLFLIRLDAMAGLGQWAALEDVLTHPDLPIPEELRLLFEARTLTQLSRGPRAELAWERVRLAVANQPDKLRDVADYAIKLGLDDVARQALDELAKDPGQRRAAYEKMVLIERRNHHLESLHQVLAEMAHDYPDDPIARNDLLYTGFLLGEATPDEIAAAEKLVATYPIMLSYRVTLALGYLTAHRPGDAAKVFTGLSIDWSTVYQNWRAVFDAVLRANGDTADANELEKLIDASDLLPEEKALLQEGSPSPIKG